MNLFFKDVGNSCHFNKLYFGPVSHGFEDSEVQSFGCVVEDGLLASQKQHRTATHHRLN